MGAVFRFLPKRSAIWLNVPKKSVFRRFDKRLFLWKCKKRHFRNVTSPMGGEHRICSTFSNFDLIGCKSTILNMKVRIRKFKCHQNIPWVRFPGNDIRNYGLILNKNGARDQKIILMKKLNFLLESAVFKIRP
jgi:hypothetical protein